ncbi:DUF2514 domain-containing protein [Pseudomonas sp. zfem002]|uniref:DUF2514 domain-containing protein n=1 Tax=Pseudomonas sp. zfem002 TaxID=3078197 RepID=UPI002927F17F|nr:DUF2514 domain-containing protein [Pseudomonas sp. zfem002]MDU9394300.1 DUF2514 domain-containing protein [Pseudomonas sp. zfem002]
MITGRTIGAAVTLLLIAVSYWAAYDHGRIVERAGWEARWAERDSTDSAAEAKAQAAARHEEQRRETAQQKAREHAQKEQKTADASALDADAAGQRLRDEASKLSASVSCTGPDSAAVARSTSAARAAMVLSELLERSVDTNRELAAAYDSARIAGLACETSYNSVMN